MPPARLTSGGLLGQGEALRYLSQVRLRRAQNIVQLCVGIGPGVPKVKEQSWTAEGNRTIETSGFPALRRPCSIGHDSPSYHGPESLNPAQEEAARKVPLGCVRREAESTQGCLAVQVSHEVTRDRVFFPADGTGKAVGLLRVRYDPQLQALLVDEPNASFASAWGYERVVVRILFLFGLLPPSLPSTEPPGDRDGVVPRGVRERPAGAAVVRARAQGVGNALRNPVVAETKAALATRLARGSLVSRGLVAPARCAGRGGLHPSAPAGSRTLTCLSGEGI